MMDSEYEAEKLLLMDKFANAAIKLNTLSRSTQISHVKIDQEIYNELFKGVPWWPQYYCTGSYYESMPLDVCGDLDMMLSERNFPIVIFNSVATTDQHTCGYVKAEHNPNEPLYLTLKAVEKDSLHADVRHIVDRDGYLKTTDFIEFNKKTIAKNSVIYNYERHGPSVAPDIELTGPGYGHTTAMMDFVFCLKCQSWSSITDSFFKRQRPGNWPSQELLNKVQHLECLVVAVSRPDNSEIKPEWRLSFSLAEKELIQHMPEPYLNCMYALKAIKNKYIMYSQLEKPTPFCSYFIKTACLWMCETFPHKEYSTIDLIKMIIDWLIDCYQRRYLQNYFIPEQNLIGSLSRERCDGVIAKLTAVKKDLWKIVISSVPMPLFVRDSVIHPMCDKLNIAKINEGDDYSDLENSIIKHPRGCDILKDAIKELIPGGSMHVLYGSLENSLWTGINFRSLFRVIDVLVTKSNVNKESIFSFPEKILVPIVSRIDEIVPRGKEELFKQSLYRYLGDVYTYLLIYFRKSGDASLPQSVYWEKPLHFYELGTGTRPSEKWSDCGMASRVSIILHYYLMENYKELKEKLATLTPILRHIKNHSIAMSRQINIETSADFYVANWSTDVILHNFAKAQKGVFVINPIALVFYINARIYLRDGDIDSARIMVKEMEKCASFILRNHAVLSTELLLKIIQSMIGLLEVARMIKVQIK